MNPVEVPITKLSKVLLTAIREKGIRTKGWGHWQRDELFPRIRVEVNTGNSERDQRIANRFANM